MAPSGGQFLHQTKILFLLPIDNCDTGNCLRSCKIEIEDAKKSTHKGMWTCTSNVKIANGRYVDSINITFDQAIIGKKYSRLYTVAAPIEQRHSIKS